MGSSDRNETEILAVSIDDHATTKRFIEKLRERHPSDYDFPFLQDTNHRVIDRYGILNPEGKGWPHPATYVIDKQGVVRWKFVEVDYRKRPSNERILEQLRKLK